MPYFWPVEMFGWASDFGTQVGPSRENIWLSGLNGRKTSVSLERTHPGGNPHDWIHGSLVGRAVACSEEEVEAR